MSKVSKVHRGWGVDRYSRLEVIVKGDIVFHKKNFPLENPLLCSFLLPRDWFKPICKPRVFFLPKVMNYGL